MNAPTEEVLERELPTTVDTGTLAVISKAEIDVQISTAHRFPRSVTKFREEALSLVTLTEDIADECIYALPRDGKTIEGPSARFAEVIASSWGNSRAGARVVDEAGDFVTAQGVFHDLQKNVAITYEVKRRIVDSKGRRYKPDMIGVTANAACSIALRNAILKGVPKALWSSVYEAARKTVMGNFQTLANRRSVTLQNFQKFGVKPEQVFEKLGIRGEEDITLEHIVVLRGLLTALKEGDTTVEESFGKGAADIQMPQSKSKPDAKEPSPPQDRQQERGTNAAGQAAPPATGEGDDDPARAVRQEEEQQARAQAGAATGPVTKGMINLVRAKLKGAAQALGDKAPTEATICQHFGVESIEALPAAKINDVFSFIANPPGVE